MPVVPASPSGRPDAATGWRTDLLLRAAKQRHSCRCGRVPHVCPRNVMTMIRMHTMHRESTPTRIGAGRHHRC